MTANEIRKKYLEFFRSKGHKVVASDSLVPKDDPTVLFTTAGMQQFKRQFLGNLDDFTRATTSQKCLRTDDLAEVGRTNFHHTFFEMLGNFSFGDYFKKEAITWAWEFLTGVVGLPPERIWVSVYQDDAEAEQIWRQEVGFPAERLVRLGDKSNFWPSNAKLAGPNGPCGPCSEIFYDWGVNPDCTNAHCDPDCDCGRFSEIWNLVFTQFNRQEGGVLEPLPAKNIDTGMGLERLTAVLQGKHNNFDTDLFMPIREAVRALTAAGVEPLSRREECVIADHIRAIVFAIQDGIIPSNKARGSVIKRLINDSTNIALNHGQTGPSIYTLVPVVVRVMAEQYPELGERADDIAALIKKAEEAFIIVRQQRIPELRAMDLLALSTAERGAVYFRFRDTYGLPLSVILSTAREQGVTETQLAEDQVVYDRLMAEQQERSRAGSKMAGDVFTGLELNLDVAKTTFVGYDRLRNPGRVLRLFVDQEQRQAVSACEAVECVLDESPFYAESGGQVGDRGWINAPQGVIRVDDTQRIADIFIHSGVVESGTVRADELVEAVVDEPRRLAIMRNHTATHLLQAGLRAVLGDHVQQQGSRVDAERLRFDFSHPKALTDQQIQAIEDFVNTRILACAAVDKVEMPLEQARQKGALAFFAEKYGETVRVVSVGDYSTEFCGGTHLDSTGQIGLLKVVGESAIAQGIRRLEAVTGTEALRLIHDQEARLRAIAQLLKAPVSEIQERVQNQIATIKQLQRAMEQYRLAEIRNTLPGIIDQARTVNGTRVVITSFDDMPVGLLRQTADLLKERLPDAVLVLGAEQDGNAQLLVLVTEPVIKKGIRANDLIKDLAPRINGSGGGRPQLAQAGGKDPSLLQPALDYAVEWLTQRLPA